MSREVWARVFIVAAALLVGASVQAQVKIVEETATLELGGRLTLEVSRGSVQLTSWEQPRVEIRARIEPPRGVNASYAQRAVDGTSINVTGTDRSVRIKADYRGVPRRWFFDRRRPQVHYEIRAPRQLDLTLDIDRSDGTVQGFDGDIALELDRSNVEAVDLSGEVTVDLDRSHLRMSDLTGEAELTMDRGRDVVLDGVDASFTLDLDRTRVSMRDVSIDGDSRVNLNRGSLDIELDEDQGLTIEADVSRRSDFSSELPLTVRESGRAITGTINGGGPLLRIHADRGEVELRVH